MARSTKNARNITVAETKYHWRATGDDGYISVTIWPQRGEGPTISCNLSYKETWTPFGDGCRSSNGDQIVVTNRLIRRIVLFAIESHAYDPTEKGGHLKLRCVDSDIDLSDAVRAERQR